MELQLFMAIDYDCQKSFVERLLQTIPANITDPMWGRTPLYYAVYKDNITIVETLLEHGADPSIDEDVLQIAVSNRSIEMVDLLLRYGVDVTVGWTISPLHIAITNGDRDMVELLARNGATSDGSSLHHAISQKYIEIVKLLLDTGAIGVNACGAYYQEPALFYAIENGDYAMVKLLLEHGAEFNKNIEFGLYLLDMAIMRRYETIAKMLIERGAISGLLIFYSDKDLDMISLLIKLLAELVFANPNIKNIASHNWQAIQRKDRHREYCELCLKDLAKMRETKIFNDVTCYDLMSKNANQLAAYARNEQFELGLLRIGLRKSFPIYSKDLARKYNRARIRCALLEEAEEVFGGLKQFALPAVCAQKILKCLEDEDLKNFIKGNRGCKDRHECGPNP